MNIIQELEREQVEKLSGGKIPVSPPATRWSRVRVKEGERSRIQNYEGV